MFCRRKHAAEHAEIERKKAERAARKEREKALRKETERMEKLEEERRRQRRLEKDRRRWTDARARYEATWKELLAADTLDEVREELRFEEIPWPVLLTEVGPSLDTKAHSLPRIDVQDLTMEAVSAFLIPGGRPADSSTTDAETMKKERRDKLRETMLRFHPDKFEGRIMQRVREKDREMAREAVGRVARIVNDLLAGKEP